MEETIDELYERYLNEKLDLLFIDAGEIKYKNDLLWILNGDRKLIRNIRIRKVANDIYILEINNKYNLIDSRTNKLLFKNFYDWIAHFSKELILIKKNGKFNLYDLNTKKELLNEWYDEICYRSFRDNVYALVKKNGLYNEINIRTNEYCHKLWYDDNSREFHFGIISVNETTKAFVDMSNNEVIVENDVYESINNPVSNYAVVKKKQSEYEYNIIDLNTNHETLKQGTKFSIVKRLS